MNKKESREIYKKIYMNFVKEVIAREKRDDPVPDKEIELFLRTYRRSYLGKELTEEEVEHDMILFSSIFSTLLEKIDEHVIKAERKIGAGEFYGQPIWRLPLARRIARKLWAKGIHTIEQLIEFRTQNTDTQIIDTLKIKPGSLKNMNKVLRESHLPHKGPDPEKNSTQ